MPKTVEFIDFHRASLPKHETAILFIHGFTGDVAKTWRAGDALMILGRTDEGIDKHRESPAQKLKPWEANSMEEQALRVADLCGLDTVYCNKLASAYEGEL